MSRGLKDITTRKFTRYYKGPVTINRLEIKLIDSLGEIINLNNSHFTLCLKFECLL